MNVPVVHCQHPASGWRHWPFGSHVGTSGSESGHCNSRRHMIGVIAGDQYQQRRDCGRLVPKWILLYHLEDVLEYINFTCGPLAQTCN